MKKPELKIGSKVDLIFENEIMKSNAHYMKASVYDYEDNKFTISQTSPALNRNFLSRRIMVTFLVKIEGRLLRFGFPAKLIDLITDYEIESNKKVEALVIEQFDESEPLDFRMYFRVKPRSQSDISLVLKEERVNLIDISLGGAKFTCLKDFVIHNNNQVKFKLLIGRTVFNLDAVVCDTGSPSDILMNKNLQYVSVKFNHSNKQLEASLGRAIIEMERQLLSEGKI